MAKKKIAVGKLVADLLLGNPTMDYGKIAERVKRRLPEARTSARSVASVAAHLRAAGNDLPDHRKRAQA